MWTLLPEGVSWKSPPLFSFEQTRNELVLRLGAPLVIDADSNGWGPYDGWAIAFPCGLEVTLSIFHLGIHLDNPTIVRPDELALVEIHANGRDFDHIRFHMPVLMGKIFRWVPEPLIESRKTWAVMRQDDNGHRYELETFTSSCEADGAAKTFEARGHKQMYWVEGTTL